MTKRHHDWFKLQKDFFGWENIHPDLLVAEKLRSMNLCINFDYCHSSLRELLVEFECESHIQPDFYCVTDIELSKKPLSELFSLYHECYKKSRIGIYLATLSYFLEPITVDPSLPDLYSVCVDSVFRKNFSFAARIENHTTMIDYPVVEAETQGQMIEGANYIFVHPNIRYFLWK